MDTEGHSVAHHSGTRYVGSSSQASISVPFPTCGSVQMRAQVQLQNSMVDSINASAHFQFHKKK